MRTTALHVTLACTFAVVFANAARGQEGPVPDEGAALVRLEDRNLGPSAEQALARHDLERALGVEVTVRWDGATGCPRTVYLRPAVAVPGRTMQEATARLLRRVSPLYGDARLDPRPDPEAPSLVHEDTIEVGETRTVVFSQRLGPARLDGAELRVTLRRDGGQTFVVSLSGRIYQDAPAGLVVDTPAPPQAPRQAELHGVTLDLGDPELVLTPRPAGEWQYAWRTVELGDQGPETVLRDARGEELLRERLGHNGSVEAPVHPVRGDRARAAYPLADLYVDAGGRVQITDGNGNYSGDSATLSGRGLWGPHEQVLGPSVRLSNDSVETAEGSKSEQAVNVFFHLVRVRRWLEESYGDVVPLGRIRTTVLGYLESGPNATTHPLGAVSDGQRLDAAIAFGAITWARGDTRALALDASVVAHERMHAFLYSLGFVARQPYSQAGGMHEGIADYLAARSLDSVWIGAWGLGEHARSVQGTLRWPQDARSGEDHEVGNIFAQALWDSRASVGDAFDDWLLAAIPTLGDHSTLLDGRDAVLAAASGQSDATRERIRRAFADHGIGDVPPARVEYRIVTPSGGQPYQGGVDVFEDQAGFYTSFEARNPEVRPAAPPTVLEVAAYVDGVLVEQTLRHVPLLDHRYVHVASAGAGRLRFTFSRAEFLWRDGRTRKPGPFSLAVSLGDSDEPFVIPVTEHARPKSVVRGTVHLTPGTRVSLPLDRFLSTPGPWTVPREYVAGENEALNYEIAANQLRLEADSRVSGGALTLTIPFSSPTVVVSLVLQVIVGDGLFAYFRDANDLGEILESPHPLPIRAGESREILVGAVAGGGAPRFSLQDAPDWSQLESLPSGGQRLTTETEQLVVDGLAVLRIATPVDLAPGSYDVPVLVQAGRRSQWLILRVLVLPGASNLPPVIEASSAVDVGGGGNASLPVRAVDPDGDEVLVDVYLVTRRGEPVLHGPQGLVGRWDGRLEIPASREPYRVFLRAIDSRGGSSRHVIDVQIGPDSSRLVVEQVRRRAQGDGFVQALGRAGR
jgi:hypothetical protein